MTAYNNIINYFQENESVFNECIEELDSYNGYLGDSRYYYMEDLNEFYSGVDPIELLNRAYFGHDESYYTDEYGQKHYEAFNPNREYFSFNGYGNLVSSDEKDYSGFLDEYFINALMENRGNLYCIDDNEELSSMFDSLETENA